MEQILIGEFIKLSIFHIALADLTIPETPQ
jgi:hypothetical protein